MEFTLKRRRIDTLSDDTLFAEMERIWNQLGHRPSRTEWEASDAKIHYNSYRRHFDGWLNACSKFIEYKMGVRLETVEVVTSSGDASLSSVEKKRDVPLRVRLKVLDRDNYTCVLCGKTPALVPGTVLHLDHVIPFSHGGRSIAENLRTLCADCNLGKGASLIGSDN